jgi:hypothetical protein
MSRRFLFRALVPAATLTLMGAIGLAPASASAATWQISSVVGDPAGLTSFTDVAASGPDNAWVDGVVCTDNLGSGECGGQTAAVEQWNGQSWQPITLPDSSLGESGFGVVVGTSSASNTWIFGADANNVGYGVHVTNSGMTEMALPANGGITFNGAAVFGPDDAWAFGISGDFNLDNFTNYAAHYNGQTWTQMPAPPVEPASVSALSRHDLWILGPASVFSGGGYEAARWTGSGWLTVPLPTAADLNLAASASINPAAILAVTANDVWVTANLGTTCPPCGIGAGVLVLHWNGAHWSLAATPSTSVVGNFDPDMAYDGRGGFWVSGYIDQPAFSGPYLYHYAHGKLSEQLAPTEDGLEPQFGDLAWVPGTKTLWGAAELNDMPGGTVLGSQGIIYQYSR